MKTLIQDLHYALRMLRKSPGFTVVAVLTLALGIGANAAIFSVVNAVLLRPLPFAQPNRIVAIYEAMPQLGFKKVTFSAPDLLAYQERQKSFETIAAFRNIHVELSGSGRAERISVARTSATLFPLLGVNPLLGRTFTAEEDHPGHPVVILSYGLWMRRYGGDPNIVGQSVALDRVPYTVIGVMPKGFEFPLYGAHNEPADIWEPMAFTKDETEGWGNMFNYSVIGRLNPGVTLEQAQAESGVVLAQIVKLYPPALLQIIPNFQPGITLLPFRQDLVGDTQTPLLVLLISVGLVLLIACANVANLLLARAAARHKEIAIRAALGAGRARLLRQMISESLLLGVVAGACGLTIAYWGTKFLVSLAPQELPRMQQIGVDGQVLLFAFCLSIGTALIFGLIPGIEASRTDPYDALKESGRGSTPGRVRRRLQNALIVAQTALAVMLLIGAGLLIRSFDRLLQTDPGFRPDRVLSLRLSLPLQAYSTPSQIRSFFEEVVRRAGTLPGVTSAGAATDLPLAAQEHDVLQKLDPKDPTAVTTTRNVTQTWIYGDYLRTMGIALIRGREFTPEDREGSPNVALISESLAKDLWANDDPIGKQVNVTGKRSTIIGIVADVKDENMQELPKAHTYTPWLQESDSLTTSLSDELRTLNVTVRTQSNPVAEMSALRGEIASVDPSLAISHEQTMDSVIQKALAPQRFNLLLLGFFAGLAIFLAAVGVYGVLSYSVEQRTHEIGLRMALGAQPGTVLGMAIREGMKLTLAGAAIGLIASLIVTRWMASLIYGVTAHDPVTFVGVTVLMCGVALVACYIPAWRASRVDPMIALRYE